MLVDVLSDMIFGGINNISETKNYLSNKIVLRTHIKN